MRITIYFKDGKIEDFDDVSEILDIYYYNDPEIWITYYNQGEKKGVFLKKDIEEIKIRME